jgi:hypothetical protein
MSGYHGDNTTGFQSPALDHIESVIDLARISARSSGSNPDGGAAPGNSQIEGARPEIWSVTRRR